VTSWVDGADGRFGVEHLPYGSADGADGTPRVVVRIGASMLDLTAATAGTDFGALFAAGSLDPLLAGGPSTWAAVRAVVTDWLTDETHRVGIEPLLRPVDGARLRLPFTVADYVDFYASEQHATNVGRLFRPESPALPRNWKHLPVGYHGRAGTVVVSGTEVRRPVGQAQEADGSISFGPSRRLDFEAEVAFVVGAGSALGSRVGVGEFAEHVFGVCLLNDWSARDIQSWEYVPLGPFLGKSFATSVAAWVTPLAALGAAWTAPPPRDPVPLPYLDDSAVPAALELQLEVHVNGEVVSRPPFASMYWTPPQLLAHLTVNGASLRAGDLVASGTVSGPQRDQWGSLLELTANATQPLRLADGSQRGFLEDGDEVVITATARAPHGRIGLGEVRGRIAAAVE
jgi:fumarylacetoacetase